MVQWGEEWGRVAGGGGGGAFSSSRQLDVLFL